MYLSCLFDGKFVLFFTSQLLFGLGCCGRRVHGKARRVSKAGSFNFQSRSWRWSWWGFLFDWFLGWNVHFLFWLLDHRTLTGSSWCCLWRWRSLHLGLWDVSRSVNFGCLLHQRIHCLWYLIWWPLRYRRWSIRDMGYSDGIRHSSCGKERSLWSNFIKTTSCSLFRRYLFFVFKWLELILCCIFFQSTLQLVRGRQGFRNSLIPIIFLIILDFFLGFLMVHDFIH